MSRDGSCGRERTSPSTPAGNAEESRQRHCEGFPVFQSDGTVVGSLDCTFTSGTGRFAGATGSYEFFLVASPRTDGGPGFATVADINGSISSVGSSQ